MAEESSSLQVLDSRIMPGDGRIALGELGFVVMRPREQRADVVGQDGPEARRRGGSWKRVHGP